MLKDGLTDPSQIPVREWVNLDAERRQAIETRLDHTAAGTEPDPNPALADELATQMTETPHALARRDLIPAIAHLPLPQRQRFRDWQAGIRRSDPATEDEVYAVKRGPWLANKMLPADMAEDEATNVRAGLVEEIATQRRITGKSPDDTDIADMLARYVPAEPRATRTLEWDPRDRPGVHRVHDGNTAMAPSAATLAQMRALIAQTQQAVIAAQRALAAAEARVAAARAAAQAIPKADVLAASAAAQALQAALQALEKTAREHAVAVEFDEYVQEQMRALSYAYAGQRFTRLREKNETAAAAALGFVPTDDAPIDAQGRQVFVNPRTDQYIVRAIDPRTPGAWELLEADLNWQGFRDRTLRDRYPDPPLKQFFPAAVPLTPEQKEYKEKIRAMEKREEEAKAAAEREADERYKKLATDYGLQGDSDTTRRIIDNLDTNLQTFVSRSRSGYVKGRLDSGMLRNFTVRQALQDTEKGATVRKILLELRFGK